MVKSCVFFEALTESLIFLDKLQLKALKKYYMTVWIGLN
jgi:hypothetical protein